METLVPLRTMIEVLTEELARADERFATIAAEIRCHPTHDVARDRIDHGERVRHGVG